MEQKLTCAECKNKFDGSRKTYVDLAYCKTCRKKHSKDILELITEDSFTIFNISQIKEAEVVLKNLEADIRLDLHKTLDTLDDDVKLPGSSCCVSYVGRLTETRIGAREEIQERIKSGQLIFGALVFARGSRKNPEAANKFTDPGSKAWFNQLVQGTNTIFVDDSDDHVLSVESIGVTSFQLYPENNLLVLLKNVMKNSLSSSGSDDSFNNNDDFTW